MSVRYDATDGAPTLKYKKGTKRVVTERILSETLADTFPKGPLGERGACRALLITKRDIATLTLPCVHFIITNT